jgi:hypothetical protein
MSDNGTPINVAINTEAPTPAPKPATLQDNLQLLFGNFFSSLANMITDEVEQRIKAAQVEKANSEPAVPTVDEMSESLMMAMQQADWFKDLLASEVKDELHDYDFRSDVESAVEEKLREAKISVRF